jgi:anti-sigma regulatory factor (Ser/Thr protein kinase)
MGSERDQKRKMSFPLTRDAPASARRWLRGTGAAVPAIRGRVLLLLSELVSNSVVHSGLAAPDEVTVHVCPLVDGVRVEVVDGGVGMGPIPPRRERSFGLRLVERIADRWGHSDHPTRVWFEVTA